MDTVSRQKRSLIMSHIRSRCTGPEKTLRKLIRSLVGMKTRLVWNAKQLPGTPDVYIPSRKLAIFVDGCFFHRCPRHGHLPKSNIMYWRAKLARNVRRDHRTDRELRNLGISVVRFWEHELSRHGKGDIPLHVRRLRILSPGATPLITPKPR